MTKGIQLQLGEMTVKRIFSLKKILLLVQNECHFQHCKASTVEIAQLQIESGLNSQRSRSSLTSVIHSLLKSNLASNNCYLISIGSLPSLTDLAQLTMLAFTFCPQYLVKLTPSCNLLYFTSLDFFFLKPKAVLERGTQIKMILTSIPMI